ncbi:MAG TPA: ABC transporter substrate-binding protein [Oscillospiraceae bacterium]|nr:ABC transporter substrate-binding protein [Oscillospiraceae bacterium]
MKNLKKTLAVALCALMAVSFTACSKSNSSSASDGKSSQGQIQIGVIQYATHPSLNNCYNGFKQGLEEAGYKDGGNIKIDFQNAQADASNADLMAKTMVSKNEKLIMGIATPAAMSAYSAAKSANIPVVFTAVSDPVKAGIVKSNEKPGNNCTGSSDVLPLEQQVKMIRAFLPNAKKIGIIYTTSEPNSISQLAEIKKIAGNYKFEIVDIGVTNASEVQAAAASIVAKGVDCINNFTDNNVVNNLSTVLQAANKAKIPVFGSEEEQVKNGCLACQGIDYVALGKETGKMAAKILKGEAKAQDMPVYVVKDYAPVYNKTVCQTLGLTLPADYKNAAAVTTTTK